MRSIRTV